MTNDRGDTQRVLVLGGTKRARKLVDWLAQRLDPVTKARLNFIYALAGETRSPRLPDHHCTHHTGGFGGMEGLRNYLREQAIHAILEALHPFARTMRARAHEAAWLEQIPILHLRQKTWLPRAGDAWIMVNSLNDVIPVLQRYRCKRPFLALGGRLSHDWLMALSGLPIENALCRAVSWNTTTRYPRLLFLEERPPYSTQEDINLLRTYSCDILVAKHSGQPASQSKLLAARHCCLPALLIRPPTQHPGHTYQEILRTLNELQQRPSNSTFNLEKTAYLHK